MRFRVRVRVGVRASAWIRSRSRVRQSLHGGSGAIVVRVLVADAVCLLVRVVDTRRGRRAGSLG